MRLAPLSKLITTCAFFLLLPVTAAAQDASHATVRRMAPDTPSDEVVKMFPGRLGDFVSQGPRPLSSLGKDIRLEDNDLVAMAEGSYLSLATGEKLKVEVVRERNDSAAYAILTEVASQMRNDTPSQSAKLDGVGTAAVTLPGRVAFFKGTTFVRIRNDSKQANSSEESITLARLFSDTLDKGEGDIPVLVKHLPDWQAAQERAVYAISLPALQEATGYQPVLDAISFDGGTEAVTADYGPSRLVIVEFNTPQLAGEMDARINARIKELRESGRPVPSAYRRVGNYSVFVFNAPDEKAAGQLIGSISYEQVVQWLGPNPHALERAQRQYTEKTANILMTVLKASGLSLLLCIGAGAAFGGIIFMRRRAQQATATAYTDAGGMLRLNLDDLTAPGEQVRLLGRGDG